MFEYHHSFKPMGRMAFLNLFDYDLLRLPGKGGNILGEVKSYFLDKILLKWCTTCGSWVQYITVLGKVCISLMRN